MPNSEKCPLFSQSNVMSLHVLYFLIKQMKSQTYIVFNVVEERKAKKSHSEEAGTRHCLEFCMKKVWIDDQLCQLYSGCWQDHKNVPNEMHHTCSFIMLCSSGRTFVCEHSVHIYCQYIYKKTENFLGLKTGENQAEKWMFLKVSRVLRTVSI